MVCQTIQAVYLYIRFELAKLENFQIDIFAYAFYQGQDIPLWANRDDYLNARHAPRRLAPPIRNTSNHPNANWTIHG